MFFIILHCRSISAGPDKVRKEAQRQPEEYLETMTMKWKGNLKADSIGKAVALADREAEKVGTEGERRLYIRLSLEETLLICRDLYGESAVVTLRMHRHERQMIMELTLPEESGGRFPTEDSPLAELLQEWKDDVRGGKACRIYTFPIEKNRRDLIRFVWKYTRPQKWWFLLGVVTQLLMVVIQVIAPLISARVIIAISDGAVEQILLAALSLLVINAVSNVLNIVCNRAYNVVYNKTLTLLEEDLVHHVLRITTRCLDQKGTGLFIQRLTQDTSQLATGFSTLADLISQSVEKIGILAAILIMNRTAFLVTMGILAVQTVIETIRTRRMKVDDHIYRNANERYAGFVSEMIRGAKDVKLTNSESTFEKELVTRITDANSKRMKMQNRSAVFRLIRMEIGSFGTYAYIAVLGLLISRGEIQPADAMVLFNYRSNIGVSAIELIGSLMEFVRGLELSAERVTAIISSPEFPKDQFGERHLDNPRGEIRFENVYFSYGRRWTRLSTGWVLQDMSFVIHPGEFVALVGASGCGKSTVFNLISKLYEANEGTVRLDGVDVRELDDVSIRGNLSVVSQNPYLFQLSIRDNLRLAKQDLTEEEMRSICKMACIDRDIMEMPDGYDTLIDENGVNLSGGQRQRLAIARALLKDSKVLMLDEATSALDNMTQARIQQAIANIRGERTVIMIAHRLSTVVNANRIMVIDQGQVVDQGTHSELIARCEIYRKLYEAESKTA